MIINYLGNGSFRLQSGDIVVSVDPPNNRWKSNVVLRTCLPVGDLATPPAEEISFSGEYEIGGIEIQGFHLAAESTEKILRTAYLVRWEDMKFVFLGNIASVPDASVIKEIEEPDVLFVPVGKSFLSADAAAKLARALEPSVVIPAYETAPADFMKAMGEKGDMLEKFVFKKKDLQDKQMRPIAIEAHSS